MPADALPLVVLARHGQTARSLSGQHAGLTDLPLTHTGENNARRLALQLQGMDFGRVPCSPLQRSRRTCNLAGFGPRAEHDARLVGRRALHAPHRQPQRAGPRARAVAAGGPALE
jgi:broad specificity phosphatase PhoE